MEYQKDKGISQAVINRIPRYYRYIQDLKNQNVMRISSKELAATMGLTASQIRQDLNCFGGFGQQGYGYNVEKLCEELAQILGLHRDRKAIIIGVGNIGRALIKNFNFPGSGFTLVCGFDANPDIIGKKLGGIEIQDISRVEDYVRKNKPDIAVLTLPRTAAPDIAKLLVKEGIRGLWNFTGEDLHLEGLGIPVENVHFSDSLMTLCYRID